MLIQILLHTPTWVYALLAALLWLGGRQLRPTQTPLRRVLILPLAMIALAVYGVVAAFGHAALGLEALAVWAVAALAVGLWVRRQPLRANVRYDAQTGLLHRPGSWLPLALILAIFSIKYGVGVTLALHPDYAQHTPLALGISTTYGVLSGIFAGRALQVWQLARRTPSLSAGPRAA